MRDTMPLAVVVDGGQWLVEFMRHAGCHLAHGDEPAGILRPVGLRRGLLLRPAGGP
jgi:hypothetical protein